jgi:methylmalonyl-CoA/ethylmalonyl-CoA epimerase
MMRRIDHVGVAVRSLDEQIPLYRDSFGMAFEGLEEVPAQQVRVAFFRAGETLVELLEPTSEAGAVARFLASRGEGMHHLGYEVVDIRAAIAEAKAKGLRVIDEEPRIGSRGKLISFLHPKTTGGVLVEFVQK